MKSTLGEAGLDQLFRAARTYPAWQDRPVSDELLRELYELAKWGPTSLNCLPARLVFLKSAAAKERLRPALSPGNLAKVMSAPVTVIVAYDTRFYERLAELWPHSSDAGVRFAANPDHARTTAFRNGTLQGAYLILAARALGLDVGPMSGFDNATVDAEFFADARLRSNFLLNIGYGDDASLRPRGPRLSFEEAAQIL